MVDDAWESLADPFVDGAYATVKGRVRTYVLHQQLVRHLPPSPASVLDVGGGAGNQSLPLARLGYDVTILDPSAAMLAKAEQRVANEPHDVRSRIGLVQAAGESAVEVTDGRQFSVVLCHGVLMYLPTTSTRGDSVEHLSELLRRNGVDPLSWYGVWLLSDWMDLAVADTDIEAVAELELRASLRDPYRQASRVFHLVGTRPC